MNQCAWAVRVITNPISGILCVTLRVVMWLSLKLLDFSLGYIPMCDSLEVVLVLVLKECPLFEDSPKV